MAIGLSSGPVVPQTVGGFSSVRPKRRLRLVMAISGLDKSGKTHQGLTAPSLMAYANLDTGLEGVSEKFEKDGKKILSKDYRVVITPDMAGNVEKIAYAANKVWEEFKSDMRAAWKSPLIRTTVVDVESETWPLIRLARFGKLTQVMPHHYGPVNAEYEGFYNEVYDSDKNLILLDRMKDDGETKIVGGKELFVKNGKLVRSGYKQIPYMVQVNMLAQCDPFAEAGNRFSVTIVNCRQNPDLIGMILPEPMCSFSTIAQMVYPDSQPSDWE